MSYRQLPTLLLCALLAVGAQASPVTWSQLTSGSILTLNSPAPGAAPSPSSDRATGAADAGTPPEFVRLPDGRIVPYGPGVICADVDVKDEVITESRSRRWLIAVPIITAVVACAVLCRGNDRPPRPPFPPTTPDPPATPPPACENPPCEPAPSPTPTPNPSPTPTPNPSPTPDPSPTPTPTPCDAPPCATPSPTPTPNPTPDPSPSPTPSVTPTPLPPPPPPSTPPVDPPTPVPEPGTLLLVGAGLALAARKKFKRGKKDDA